MKLPKQDTLYREELNKLFSPNSEISHTEKVDRMVTDALGYDVDLGEPQGHFSKSGNDVGVYSEDGAFLFNIDCSADFLQGGITQEDVDRAVSAYKDSVANTDTNPAQILSNRIDAMNNSEDLDRMVTDALGYDVDIGEPQGPHSKGGAVGLYKPEGTHLFNIKYSGNFLDGKKITQEDVDLAVTNYLEKSGDKQVDRMVTDALGYDVDIREPQGPHSKGGAVGVYKPDGTHLFNIKYSGNFLDGKKITQDDVDYAVAGFIKTNGDKLKSDVKFTSHNVDGGEIFVSSEIEKSIYDVFVDGNTIFVGGNLLEGVNAADIKAIAIDSHGELALLGNGEMISFYNEKGQIVKRIDYLGSGSGTFKNLDQ